MATTCKRAAKEALLKFFLLGLFWAMSLWCLEYLPFNWTKTALTFVQANIIQEPVFHILLSILGLIILLSVAGALISWLNKRKGSSDPTIKHGIEIAADLADTGGCALALLMFAFLTTPFTSGKLGGDLVTVLSGSGLFLLLSYLLLWFGKRYAV